MPGTTTPEPDAGAGDGAEVAQLVRRGRLGAHPAERRGDQRPAGRGRRVCEHGDVAVGELERLPLDDPVPGEVVGGHEPAGVGQVLDHRSRQRAVAHRARPGAADVGQRLGEVRQHHPLALAQQPPPRRVHRGGSGRRDQHLAQDLVQVGGLGPELHALARQAHRRLHQVGQRQPPRAAVGLAEPGDHAGYRDRRRPDVEHLVGAAEGHREGHELAGVQGPAGGPQPGHGDEEVEQEGRPVGRAVEQEAARAGPGEWALGDRARERRGADGVDGRAAAREGLGAGACRQAVPRGHRPDGSVGTAPCYAASSGSSNARGRRTMPVDSGSSSGGGSSSTSKTPAPPVSAPPLPPRRAGGSSPPDPPPGAAAG